MMHAVVTRATIRDLEQADQTLNNEGIQRLRQMSGFVGGQWFSFGGGQGGAVVMFETEDEARTAAEQLRANPAAGSAVTLESVEVAEIIRRA